MKFQPYKAPETELIMLCLRRNILDLSNFGDPGEPGDGFGDGIIIIDSDF